MTYGVLRDLTESKMFPSKTALSKEDFPSLTEYLFLMIVTLRILLHEGVPFALKFFKKANQTNYKQWRGDGNDLYMVLHSLTAGLYPEDSHSPESLNCAPIQRWLREVSHPDKRDETETARLFVRLDRMLWIKESSMKAVRRLVQDWPELSDYEKRLAMTRLLQMIRARMPKSELLIHLQKVARERHWELQDVCNAETGDGCDDDEPERPRARGYVDPMKQQRGRPSFLASLAGVAAGAAGGYALTRHRVKEEASAGGTGAGNVASVVTPLGAQALGPGFAGKNGHKGIYQPVIRRGEPPK